MPDFLAPYIGFGSVLKTPSSDGTNGQAMVTDGAGVLSFVTIAGGGGGMTIGDPVSGGTANRVLFVDGSGNLGDDAGLVYDASTDRLGIGGTPSQALDLIGAMELEDTTSSTTGVIYKGSTRFLHNFHHPTGGTAVPDGQNVFVGEDAGNFTMGSTATQTDHGSYNSVLGYAALYSNTTGSYNSVLGYAALYSNTTGSYNSALGAYALRLNTTGYRNSVLGYAALYSNTTGYDNSALGNAALYSNTTGYDNSALGNAAGRYIADGSSPNQTSNTSVYFGASTKSLANGDSNEIVIGYNATGLGSNTAVLGNTSITTTSLNGQTGINQPSPAGQLHVVAKDATTIGAIIEGAATPSADYLQIRSNGAGSGDVLAVDSNGGVNVNGAAASGRLNVAGDGSNYIAYFVEEGNVGATRGVLIRAHANASAAPFFLGEKSRGTAASPTIINNGDSLFSFAGRGYDGVVYRDGGAISVVSDGTPASGSMPGRIVFYTTASGSLVERMRITSAGKFGFGTDNPLDFVHLKAVYPSVRLEGTGNAGINLVDTGSTSNYQVYQVMSDADALSFARINDGVTAVLATPLKIANDNIQIPIDNSKLLFGAGQDASIYYDSTNMYINPQEVGSGNLVVNAGALGVGTIPSGARAHIYDNALANVYLKVQTTQATKQAAVELITGTAGADWVMYIPGSSDDLHFYAGGDKVTFQKEGSVGIGTSTFDSTAIGTLAIANGTAPAAGTANQFYEWSEDIVAGNAAPHFMTENGTTIVLDQDVQTSASPSFANLTLTGTESIQIPVGTDAQRPGVPVDGDLRVNSTSATTEIFRAGAWHDLEVGGTAKMDAVQLMPADMNLPASSPATVDLGTTQHMVLFDDTVNESGNWTNLTVNNYQGGNLTIEIGYTMASATSGSVVVTGELWAITPGDAVDVDTESYGTAVSVTDAVPATAGYLGMLTLTFDTAAKLDNLAEGDLLAVRITRDAVNASDTATGDLEVRTAICTEL